jgi:hypothetical protein
VEAVAVPWLERYQRVTRLMAQAVVVQLQASALPPATEPAPRR